MTKIIGLTDTEIGRIAQPLETAYTLPPQAYTDPQIYDQEVAHIMRKSWLPLARVDQLPKPGDFLALDLFDQPIMVVHGTDGTFRVMSRVCLHRAAPLIEGVGNRKLFSCPYHAWSYDTSGQLIKAPHMEGADGFSETTCRLPQLKTEIWNGFILANFDPDAAPFAPPVQSLADYFKNFELADMAVARTLEFDSHWNWKVLVENFMEAYHHIATHSETFEPAYHARDSKTPDTDGPWSILHMPAASDEMPDPTSHGPTGALEDWQVRDLFANVAFPHFLFGLQGLSLVWYQVLPQSVDRLLLKIHICLPKSELAKPGADEIVQGTAEMMDFIHREDIGANDFVWRGLKAPMTQQGRLSPLEKSIWQFNQWWLDAMGQDGI
ncbi:MAG: phenylpropionate dioxygenase-like ring-hydroxylating dioxygenase large terminal subunit [Parvibaculaceae bacterium]|jgi:phenylpropionate dioxygenase-like ring-hydroxylating dioxygenase large terminal subunit